MRIVTLATCHNRREKTLRALEDLHSQEISQNVELIHVLVDDGSTDDTSRAVTERFPDVEIIYGDGNLYWAGGMRYGWEQSVKYKNFDFLFVYNDDVEFFYDALERLIKVSRAYLKNHHVVPYVIVGSCQSKIDQSTTYGGYVRNSLINPLAFKRICPPTGRGIFVDSLNMNCALINRDALSLTNFLAAYFSHGGADIEFGIRLRKSGGAVILAPKYFGYCERNPGLLMSQYNLRSYFKHRLGVKGFPFQVAVNFCRAHGGVFWPYSFIRSYLTKLSVKLFVAGKW
jgi:GT2 family glycosyltransferase